MKKQDIKNLYPVTPEIHNNLIRTLNRLDEVAPLSCRRRRSAVRLAVAFAIITVLAAFTAAACATDLFGLRSEKVGRYGLKLSVVDETTAASTEKKHVKPVVGYLPEGCRLVDGSNQTKKYWYTTGGKEVGYEISVGLTVCDADSYSDELYYIVETEEFTFNGHKTVIGTQQPHENGDKYYFAVEYFEDWGYVVVCSCSDRGELVKFMQALDLEEDPDYAEPATAGEFYHDPVDDYAFTRREEYYFIEVGDTFGYSRQIYDDAGSRQDDYTVKLVSVEERDSFDGLDRQYFAGDDVFSDYFDANGRLITPYIRTDTNYNSKNIGVDELLSETQTETGRHFFVITAEVKANIDTSVEDTVIDEWAAPLTVKKDGSCEITDTYDTAVCLYRYIPDFNKQNPIWKKGDSRTCVFGVFVDDGIYHTAALCFRETRYNVDHNAEAVEGIEKNFCVMLKGGDAK